MSNCFSTKCTIVVNAIAITTALAIISGYLPASIAPLNHLQAVFQAQQILPKR